MYCPDSVFGSGFVSGYGFWQAANRAIFEQKESFLLYFSTLRSWSRIASSGLFLVGTQNCSKTEKKSLLPIGPNPFFLPGFSLNTSNPVPRTRIHCQWYYWQLRRSGSARRRRKPPAHAGPLRRFGPSTGRSRWRRTRSHGRIRAGRQAASGRRPRPPTP